MVFLPVRHFLFFSLWLPLGIPSWILRGKVKSWWGLIKFSKKSLGVFYLSDIFFLFPSVVPWVPILDPGGKREVLR